MSLLSDNSLNISLTSHKWQPSAALISLDFDLKCLQMPSLSQPYSMVKKHKYAVAVYTPLFATAMISVLAAALRELAVWRKERAAAAVLPEGDKNVNEPNSSDPAVNTDTGAVDGGR
ncbi:hypothetical protein BDP27DRAFT_1363308 [Rhodocollybia butyracea]|uniref:Uncharacterized protein n=1 Tax=Rhodocollybia butyracea TaxID=206335 RepID=A0A9P5U7X9_9AGAR|nr:hypothetical protein BDP27DRAFT_1363308 [Rhodocollybia butyracea]